MISALLFGNFILAATVIRVIEPCGKYRCLPGYPGG